MMARGSDGKPVSPPSSAPFSGPDPTTGSVPKIWDDDPDQAHTAPTDIARKTSGFSRKAEVRPARRALLLVMTGTAAGRVLLLDARKVTVGRSRQADVTLADEGVSRMHCGIARVGESYVLTDLGSTHGTSVNGTAATRVELAPGDRIQLGPDTLIEFDVCDAAEQGVLEKLYRGATRDLLTHALNRRAFEERLAAEVSFAVRHRAALCAVAVEVDLLAQYVNKYGNAACDIVLREVSTEIGAMLRGEDVLARTQANGFVILARGLTAAEGASLADRMRKVVDERVITFRGSSKAVTISGGVSDLAECTPECSGSALLELAETRLASARAAGPNRIVSKP
jgi:diguanylate cyclase (GGDEF)-like protein